MAATAPKVLRFDDDVDLFLTPPQARRIEPVEAGSETVVRVICFAAVVGLVLMLATVIGVGVMAVQAIFQPLVQAEVDG